MRIAVTGSSGLLGRHVVAALSGAGHDVLGIDAASPPVGAPGRHVTADVTDLGALVQVIKGCEAVIHGAAIPRPTGHDPGMVFRTNVAASYGAVEAAAVVGIRRFVHVSSFSVLGYPFFERPVSPPYLPVDEGHPVGAQDAYALSKWLGEEILEAAVRRGAFPGAVSLRMPWIQTPETFVRDVGPRRVSPDAARDLWAYIDARDAASACLAAVERPIDGHLRLLVSASDTFMEAPTAHLVAQSYPDVAIRGEIEGVGAAIDTRAAQTELRWAPRYSWRDYPTEPER